MYKKEILSFIAIIVFALLAGASDDSTELFIVISINIVIVVVAIVKTVEYIKSKKAERAKAEIEEKLEETYRKLDEIKEEERNIKYNKLLKKLSYTNKVIVYDFDHYVMVDEKNSQIMLNEHIYNFDDIISYTVLDGDVIVIQEQIGGEIISTSSTDTGSMLGRAMVGGAWAGDVGAVIGGLTANRTTISRVEPSTTIYSTFHDYLISVTVNSISNPIERLKLEDDELKTNEICALLSMIISRNK